MDTSPLQANGFKSLTLRAIALYIASTAQKVDPLRRGVYDCLNQHRIAVLEVSPKSPVTYFRYELRKGTVTFSCTSVNDWSVLTQRWER